MRGRVKRGKGRSLGFHDAVGREGRCTWRRWRTGAAVMRASARIGEGRGKGIRDRWASSACWPFDGLGRRPLGQKAEPAGGADWAGTEEKFFLKQNWIF
jgi:hypothetical protein